MSTEQSIPTYFSAAMLLAAAGLLWTIARVAQRDGRPFARHWHWLAVIFVCLSLDEICSIHELTMKPMRRVLGEHATGLLYYAWVVPAAGGLLVLGLAYLRFVLHLAAEVRNRMVAAGILYVGGAMGMELIGGYLASTSGTRTAAYAGTTMAEEVMEMLGVVLFIHALFIQMAGRGGSISVRLIEVPKPPLLRVEGMRS